MVGAAVNGKVSTPTGSGERRGALRYSLDLPVELRTGRGRTRNMSASGVLLETDPAFSPASPLRFSVILGRVEPGLPLRLECTGEVVRVARRGGRAAVAVAITSYR